MSYNTLDALTTHFPIADGENVISYQDQYPRSYYEPYNTETNPDGYTNDRTETLGQSSADGDHQHDATVVDTAWYAYTHIRKSSSHSIRQHNNIPHNGVVYTTATPPIGYTLDTTGSGKAVNACTYNTTGGTVNHTHPAAGSHSHSACLPTHLHATSGCTTTGTSAANCNTEQGTVARTPSHTHTISGDTSNTPAATAVTLTSISNHLETAQTHEPAHVILGAARRTSISIRQLGVPSSSIIVWRNTLASIPTGFALTDGSGGRPNYLDKFIKIAANTGEIGTTAGSHNHQQAAQSHTHTHSGGLHSHTVSLTTGSASTNTSPGIESGTTTNTSIFNGSCNTAGFSADSDAASHQHASATIYAKSIEVALIQKT